MSADGGTTIPLATRDRIVDVALKLFSERETVAVSMRELADAAGVTVPGLYYHFESKAALIRAVYEARFSVATDSEPPLTTPGLVEALIVAQARRELALAMADREFLRFMHRESIRGDPDALEAGGALREERRARWFATLVRATDVAPDADLHAAADLIGTFVGALFVENLIDPERAVEPRVEHFARLIAPALRSGAG